MYHHFVIIGNLFENRKENRHYYNQQYQIRVDCYVWLPEYNIIGYDEQTKKHKQSKKKHKNPMYHIDLKNACFIQHQSINNKKTYLNAKYFNYKHPIHNFNYTITTFLSTIIQLIMPDYLIINQGLWKYPKLHNDYNHFNEFINIAKQSTKRLIWKTTTASCDDKIINNRAYYNNHGLDTNHFIDMLQQSKIELYDAFLLTKDVTQFNSRDIIICWDRFHHFQSFVYRELNKQLLKLLLFPEHSSSNDSSDSNNNNNINSI